MEKRKLPNLAELESSRLGGLILEEKLPLQWGPETLFQVQSVGTWPRRRTDNLQKFGPNFLGQKFKNSESKEALQFFSFSLWRQPLTNDIIGEEDAVGLCPDALCQSVCPSLSCYELLY